MSCPELCSTGVVGVTTDLLYNTAEVYNQGITVI